MKPGTRVERERCAVRHPDARWQHLPCDREVGHLGSHRIYIEQQDTVLFWPNELDASPPTTRPNVG